MGQTEQALAKPNANINGFYAAFLTGTGGQGFVMLIFRNGNIIGVDASGVHYDGAYVEATGGHAVKLRVAIPPNTLLVQGVSTGPQVENSEQAFTLPVEFLALPFIRVDAAHGPVNVRLVKLRELND